MKIFKINRFSLLTDKDDEDITAIEIENMLNRIENERNGYTQGCAKWTVKELK